MRRKIMTELERWKETSGGRTALLIEGARRVGKSFLAEEFAKEHYRSYILIDFAIAGDEVKELFVSYLNDLDTLFLLLSNIYHTRLYRRESLIIFDEVAEFPRARTAVKYLVKDGRYDYLETGSLLSIKKNVRNILLPSEERPVQMFPMDFEEYLWATGNDMMMDLIRVCYEKKRPMGQAMHRKAMDALRQYMIVGGMPQAVAAYLETKDFEETDRVKRDILALYRGDIRKHAEGAELKAEALFDELPSQLQKHDRKFRITALGEGARTREYEDAIFWLKDSMMVNFAFNATEPTVGLKMSTDHSTMKCYMGDTGLLISHAFDENGLVTNDLYQKLLLNKLEVNTGMIVENLVAQMLTASGHKLYFYARSSADAAERMEVDFLLAKDKISSRHNISPIEVKSSKRYTMTSLNKFRMKYHEQVNIPYVLHEADLKEEGGILYLPLYMTPLL